MIDTQRQQRRADGVDRGDVHRLQPGFERADDVSWRSSKKMMLDGATPILATTASNASGSGFRRPRSDETNTAVNTASSSAKRSDQTAWWLRLLLVKA